MQTVDPDQMCFVASELGLHCLPMYDLQNAMQ